MMPNKMPGIREFDFPDDDRFWRLDWVGAVERTGSDTLINVHFSPQKAGASNFQKVDAFDADKPKMVRVSIGLLPCLAIGSLWQHGQRVGQNSGESISLKNVIVPAKPDVLLAGAQLEPFEGRKRWLIPNFVHPVRTGYWHAPCLCFEHDGDPNGIVIPAIEVIRFYYAVSSDLARLAFSGDLLYRQDEVLNQTGNVSDGLRDDGNMVLHLRKHLADEDAWVLGRVLASERNRIAFNRIYNSLIYRHRAGSPLYAIGGFPFEGSTAWEGLGRSLPSNIPGKRRWLIHELKSCSAPFPFHDVVVIRDNDNRKAPSVNEELKLAWAHSPTHAHASEDAKIQSHQAPSSRYESVSIPSAGERFTALRGRQIIKLEKEACQYHRGHQKSETVEQFGMLEASASGSSHGIAPAEVSWDRHERAQPKRPALPASFDAMMSVIEALNQLPGVTARQRALPGNICYMPLTKAPGARQWSYLDSSTLTLRQVIVVDLVVEHCFGSLIEFERRDHEHVMAALLISTRAVTVSNQEILTQLTRVARAKGVWSKITRWPQGMRYQFFKHSRPTPDEFAKAIQHVLVGVQPR